MVPMLCSVPTRVSAAAPATNNKTLPPRITHTGTRRVCMAPAMSGPTMTGTVMISITSPTVPVPSCHTVDRNVG